MKVNKDETPAAYKIRTCQVHRYRVFVESDAEIVEQMTAANIAGLTIIHFDNYITKNFNDLAHSGELFNFVKD
jgi:hypothetical protein